MAVARSLHVVFDGVMRGKIGQKSTPICMTVPVWCGN